MKKRNWERNPDIFSHLSEETAKMLNNSYNPHGLDRETLTFYYDNPELPKQYDIRDLSDCEKVVELTKAFQLRNGISLKRDIL